MSGVALSLALLAIGALTQSCESRGSDVSGPYETFTANMPVSYPMLKQMVLTTCLQCHGEFNDEGAFDKLINSTKPDQSIVMTMVEDGEMPKGGPPLSSSEIAMMRAYVEQYAKAHEPAPLPPVEPTWTSIQANLIGQYCIQCHTQGHKKPYMDDYGEVSDAAYDMASELAEGHMPPKGHPRPDPRLIQAFMDWVNNNTPEN